MQTLKTAAIVVLLMTVMYGAYVSMTTPPESLPPDVEDMLVLADDGSLMIDSALPPSLGELDINTGSLAGAPEATQPMDSDAAPIAVTPSAAFASSQPASPSMSQSGANFATLSPAATPNAGRGGSPMGGMQLGSPQPLVPPANSPANPDAPPAMTSGTPVASASFSISDKNDPAAALASSDSYPRTNRTFALPSPSAAQASFDPTNGQPFASSVAVQPVSASGGSVSGGSASGGALPAASQLGGASINQGLANAIQTADRQYASDQRKEALSTLSIFYSTPNLTGEQRSELLSRLDPLAAEVIYSRRHLLETPHRVGQNETLIEIARRYEVPWQLLANINQIQDPVTVLPGTELKVVRGPFRAEVDLALSELTLFLGDLYAGRFPIGIGNDPRPKPGTFTVQDKQESRTYYDAAGSPVPPGSPDNPYGNAWIDLGGQLSIHGSPSTTNPTDKGCISLAADYADDLYGILSQGSSVTIRN